MCSFCSQNPGVALRQTANRTVPALDFACRGRVENPLELCGADDLRQVGGPPLEPAIRGPQWAIEQASKSDVLGIVGVRPAQLGGQIPRLFLDIAQLAVAVALQALSIMVISYRAECVNVPNGCPTSLHLPIPNPPLGLTSSPSDRSLASISLRSCSAATGHPEIAPIRP